MIISQLAAILIFKNLLSVKGTASGQLLDATVVKQLKELETDVLYWQK